MALTDEDREVLAIASRYYRHPGNREVAARWQLDMSAARFWQRVVALINNPDAEREFPELVHRLQRRAERMRRQRELRQAGGRR